MSENWPEFMAKASDDLCRLYVRDWHMWSEEPVEAAIAELKKRGQPITPEIVQRVREGFRKKAEHEQEVASEVSLFNANHSWHRNITTDESAPELYSELSIWNLGSIFSILIATYMMASNIATVKNRTGVVLVTLAGMALAIPVYFMLHKLITVPGGGPLYLYAMFNTGGIFLMRVFFWSRFIGSKLEYRPKSIRVPMIFGLTLVAILVIILSFAP